MSTSFGNIYASLIFGDIKPFASYQAQKSKSTLAIPKAKFLKRQELKKMFGLSSALIPDGNN